MPCDACVAGQFFAPDYIHSQLGHTVASSGSWLSVLYVVSLIGTPLGMLAVDAVGGMPLLAVIATCFSACGTALLGFDSPFGVLTHPAWSKVLFAGLVLIGVAQVLLHPFLYPMLATLVATKHFFVFRALVLCVLHANTVVAHVTFGAITHMDASYWWFVSLWFFTCVFLPKLSHSYPALSLNMLPAIDESGLITRDVGSCSRPMVADINDCFRPRSSRNACTLLTFLVCGI